jgi:hypothetical protein
MSKTNAEQLLEQLQLDESKYVVQNLEQDGMHLMVVSRSEISSQKLAKIMKLNMSLKNSPVVSVSISKGGRA